MLDLHAVKEKLLKALPGAKVTIWEKPGHQHVGKPKVGAHLKMEVIYDGFAGKSIIEQHKMVYDQLKEEMVEDIHSLQLTTKIEE